MPAPSISVQRGAQAVPRAASTLINLPTPATSLGSTLVLNTNNRRMSGGYDNLTSSNLDADDMSGAVGLSSISQLEFGRIGTTGITQDTRIAWEAIEYIGPSGGNNEFIVRGRYQLTLTGETTTATVSGITNIDRCIPYITGLMCSSTADDASHSTAIAWMSGSDTLNIKRGGGSSDTVYVWVSVVEYTGSNYDVKHGRIMSNADSGTINLVDAADGTTVGGGDIGDWSQALIVHQFVGNALNGVDDSIADTSAVYEPGANTSSVDWIFHSNHVDSAGAGLQNEHFVHVLQHPDLVVSRFSDTNNSAGARNLSIASAGLTDISQATVEVSRSSSGNGTAYGRGWVNARITSTTNVELWIHRSGNTINTQIQIADWSGVQDPDVGGDPFVVQIYDGATWHPAAMQTHNGTTWGPMSVEIVTT